MGNRSRVVGGTHSARPGWNEWFRRSLKAGAALVCAAGLLLPTIAGAAAAQARHSYWWVDVGTHTVGSAVQGLGFYPNVITIDAGDTITFVGEATDPDTVSFLNGTRPPVPGSPASLAPAGTSTCCTAGIFTSSGIMQPGNTYLVTFPKPGVFIETSLLHGGRQGVVIVNPAGTAYPMTQAQYNVVAQAQARADLLAGLAAQASYHLFTSPGPGSATTFHVATGISPPEEVGLTLAPAPGSADRGSGKVVLALAGPGRLALSGSLSGLSAGSHAVLIGLGTCAARAGTFTVFPSVQTSSSGTFSGRVVATVPPPTVLAEAGWFVEVAGGAGLGSPPALCGNVVFHNATVVRFLPSALTIHAGDQVVWTNLSVNNIHTVTFLAPGQSPPRNPAVPPAGGKTVNRPGYFNSSVLLPFQQYSLSFTAPGTYSYRCLFHDELGMLASITVVANP